MLESAHTNEEILHVRISKATSVVWEGEALSISSRNSHGPFDILGMHSNFITLVGNDPIIIKTTQGEENKYIFNQSVISVKGNMVNIFSNIE